MYFKFIRIVAKLNIVVAAFIILDVLFQVGGNEIVVVTEKNLAQCHNSSNEICYSLVVSGEKGYAKRVNEELYSLVEVGTRLKVSLSGLFDEWVKVEVWNDITSTAITLWSYQAKSILLFAFLFLPASAGCLVSESMIKNSLVSFPVLVLGGLSIFMLLRFIDGLF